MLKDNLFSVRRLASGEENIWGSFDHKWIFFTEGETPESVRSCRAEMSCLQKKLELADRGSSFFLQLSVQVDIVQILSASA